MAETRQRKTNTLERFGIQISIEPSQSAAAIRIRDNQRRSRARRKEYVENLERKVQEYERLGVDATMEMQHAARTVALENSRLRIMLARMGVSDTDVDAFLQVCQDREAAEALSSVSMRPMHHEAREQEQERQPKSRSKPRVLTDTDTEEDVKTPRTQPSLTHIVTSMTSLSPKGPEAAVTSEAEYQRHIVYSYASNHRSSASPLDVLASATLQQVSREEAKAHGVAAARSVSEAPSPSTIEPSTGAVTPSSAYASETSPSASAVVPVPSASPPLTMTCDAAAAIIADMQGQSDNQSAKARMGCRSPSRCFARDSMLFRMLNGGPGTGQYS